MTRKDFRLIASGLHDMGATEAQARIMANYLYGTNPHFDRERFIRAAISGEDGNFK